MGPQFENNRNGNRGTASGRKADINARDKNGQTPLHYASSKNLNDMVEFFIARGADVNAKDNNGKTPLDVAGTSAQNSNQPRPLVQQPGRLVQSGGAQFNASQNSAPGNSRDAASILREHGGVSEVELSTIRVMRKGDVTPIVIARRSEVSDNRYTLFEAFTKVYIPPARFHAGGFGEYSQGTTNEPPGYRFPDFSGIQIHRSKSSGSDGTSKIDLVSTFSAGDCSKNVELKWGDVIEIPETDHKINETWLGLDDAVGDALAKCLRRQIEIVVKGQATRFTLLPRVPIYEKRPNYSHMTFHFPSPASSATDKQVRYFSLSDVVHDANVILASSDLTQVKVRRTDTATGKKTEMTFNLEKTDPETDLLLKDGDVIEIPEKQGQ